MSLINQVLQDLQERRAQETDGNPMMAAAGARHASGKRRRLGYLGVVLPVVLVGALGAGYGPWRAVFSPVDEPATPPEPVLVAQSEAPAAPTPTLSASMPLEREAVQQTRTAHTPAPVEDAPAAPASQAPAPKPMTHPAEPVVLAKAAPEPIPVRADAPPKNTSPEPANDAAMPAQGAASSAGVHRRPDPRAQAATRYAQSLEALRGADPVKAEGLLREALALDARHARARHALVVLLIEDGRLQEAERLSRAETGRAWNSLRARLLLKRGETERAIAELEAGLPGADADYQALLAALYQRRGRHGDAVELYRRALGARPTQAAWWAGLGISLEGEGRGPQAVNAYRRALALPGLGAPLRDYLDQRLAALAQSPSSQALNTSP